MNFQPRQAGQAGGVDVGHDEDGAGRRVGPRGLRVQAAESAGIEVVGFGEAFLDGDVAHVLQARAFQPGIRMRAEGGMVGGGDGAGRQDSVGVAEGGDEAVVKLSGGGPVVAGLPRGQGLRGLGPPAAVNAAGREMGAVQAGLDGEDDIDGCGGPRRRRGDRPGDGRPGRRRPGCRRVRDPDAAAENQKAGQEPAGSRMFEDAAHEGVHARSIPQPVRKRQMQTCGTRRPDAAGTLYNPYRVA